MHNEWRRFDQILAAGGCGRRKRVGHRDYCPVQIPIGDYLLLAGLPVMALRRTVVHCQLEREHSVLMSMRHTRHSERGQSLVLVTFALFAMMGIIGLAVDLGWAFYIEKTAQAAADAAALA